MLTATVWREKQHKYSVRHPKYRWSLRVKTIQYNDQLKVCSLFMCFDFVPIQVSAVTSVHLLLHIMLVSPWMQMWPVLFASSIQLQLSSRLS